jgi:hypothetical protein
MGERQGADDRAANFPTQASDSRSGAKIPRNGRNPGPAPPATGTIIELSTNDARTIGGTSMIRTGYVTAARAKRPLLLHPGYRLLFAAAIASAIMLVSMLVDAAIIG